MTTTAPPPTTETADALLQVLGAQCEGHARILELLQSKRGAIRTGEIDAIASACDEEQKLVHALGEAEARRRTLVAHLTRTLRPDRTEPLAIPELASALDRARGEALRTLAARLRGLVDEVRQESTIVTAAADALSRHLAGIMQTVHSSLSQAGVYERRGRIAVTDHAHCCVDIKS